MPEVIRLAVVNQRPHISFSEVGSFDDCQWRWKLDYHDGHRSKVFGIDLSFGTAMHSTLEMLKNKAKDKRPSLAKAQSMFVRKLVKEHMDIKRCILKEKARDKDYEPRKYALRNFVDAGKRILEKIDDLEELREGDVIWNEFPILSDIDRSDDLKIKFKGFIDIAIRIKGKKGKDYLYICDFKTCSWGWGRDKRTDENKHLQLYLYKHFVCKQFKLDPKAVKTSFILLKKTPQKGTSPIEIFTISSGPKALEKALDKLQTTITAMHSGVFVKNRSSCENQWGKCPYFKTDLCEGP